jgi:4-carboxymuconolactone decarboxylase
MARLADLTADQMNPAQTQAAREIGGSRGGAVRGPFAVWLRLPEVASCASRLGDALRVDGMLDKPLFELAVLIVARHWSAPYMWFVHAKDAADAGIAADVIEAVRTNRTPVFSADDQRMVYDLVTELIETKTVRDPTYRRAVDRLGVDRVIEVVAAAGFYTLAAMTIKAFDAPVPGGAKPFE